MFDIKRIISGIVMAAVVVLVALINDKILTFVLFAGILFLAFNEAKNLFKADEASVVLALLFFIIAFFSKEAISLGILLVILVLGYMAYRKSEDIKQILPYIYPTVPIFALWHLYVNEGMFELFWLIFIVVICDSFAYFTGKFIGTKQFSQSSTSKTVEGVVGGLVFASILGAFVGFFSYGFFFSLFVSFVVAVFGVLGDLIESYFKRRANVKDSGSLIPGHGGILDRIDAVIIASIAMVVLV